MAPETVILPNGKEVVLIHHMVGGRIVCMPNLELKNMCSQKERAAPHMRTDDLSSVTCPMCKRLP
jgi:hypothetical protein